MSRGVDADEVRRLAGELRLRLEADEPERLAGTLDRFFERFERLPAPDPTGAAVSRGSGPEDSVDGRAPDPPGLEPAGAGDLREDVPAPDPLHRPPSSLAPEWRDGFYLVPGLPGLVAEEGAG